MEREMNDYMTLQEDSHPRCAVDEEDPVGDRARAICAGDGEDGEDDEEMLGDGDEDWLPVARLGRLTDRPGVDAFFPGPFFPDFFPDAAADGVTDAFTFFADLVGVRDLARLAAGVFFAVDFFADRAGVAFRTGVDGVPDFPAPAPFLPGVLAMVMMGDRFVSSDFTSLFIRCVDTVTNPTAEGGKNQEWKSDSLHAGKSTFMNASFTLKRSHEFNPCNN